MDICCFKISIMVKPSKRIGSPTVLLLHCSLPIFQRFSVILFHENTLVISSSKMVLRVIIPLICSILQHFQSFLPLFFSSLFAEESFPCSIHFTSGGLAFGVLIGILIACLIGTLIGQFVNLRG